MIHATEASTPVPDRKPRAFQVMLKPHGPICNLSCSYCYYLAKDRLYPGADFRMTDALLEEFTRQYIAAQPAPEITFAWQGGEPTLMGLEFFQRAVELQEKYRPPAMRIHNALQTNGTLLDDDWCEFLSRHDFLVGVSLDGPRHLHDAFRKDKRGRGSFDRVMAGIALLRRQGVDYNILATVHSANARHPLEVYRFLRDEVGTRFIQFIPIVQPVSRDGRGGAARVTPQTVSAEAYGEFLVAIFDEWALRDVGQVFVQIFDSALAAWVEGRPGLCILEKTCGTAMAMEHNGDLYACDHFVDPPHFLGNIRERPLAELATSAGQQRFGQDKWDALPSHCRSCPVCFVCHGGCPKDRFCTTPTGEPGLSYLCEGYRAFFTHIHRPMELMAAEVRAGQPAANAVPRIIQEMMQREREHAHVGRNDPCPCGSGRKYKHCHGRTS